ncbi:MAG: hypothetical protein AAGA48_23455 [Myxococcota bacterium]
MASDDPLAGADPSDASTFLPAATALLTQWGLQVGEQLHGLAEVEFYSHAPGHEDPFTHQHPGQRTQSSWYFHQEGKSFRGGTFKGLDLTFGPANVPTGILIRTLRKPDGSLVNGSSNCVEHLLTTTGHPTVAALHGALGGRTILEPGGPLQLVRLPKPLDRPVIATARVGLTLARAARYPAMTLYFGQPYRFLTEPTIRKGKPQTILALHRQGHETASLPRVVSSTKPAVQRAIDAFERGRNGDLTSFIGQRIATTAWPEVYGAWVAASD